MANVFQAVNSGYRDPYKTMTLKALEARAKAAQDQMNTALQPTQIANPYQGIAGMLDVAGAGMREGRVEQAGALGRADLADAMAHIDMQNGPDAATIARISVRDPELAQHLYDQAMERKNKQDEMKFQAGEHALDRTQRGDLQKEAEDATARNQGAQISSTEGIAARTQEGENTRLGATLGSQQSLETQREAASSLLESQKAGSAIELEKTKAGLTQSSKVGQIIGDYNKGAYNMPGEDQNHPNTMRRVQDAINAENQRYINAQPEGRYAVGSAEAAVKRHTDIITAADVSKHQMNNIRQLAEIGKRVQTGPGQALKLTLAPFAQIAGMDAPPDLPDLQAYSAIADKLAPNMRVQGAGSSSDFDAKQFLNSLPKISNLPGANQIIEATFAANDAVNQEAARIARLAQSEGPDRITWQEADRRIAALPNPFDNFKDYMKQMSGQLGTGTEEDPNDPLGRHKRPAP